VKTSSAALSDFYHRHHKALPAGAGVTVMPAANGFTITINIRLQPPPCSHRFPFASPTSMPPKN
jgi:hypothetical protein